MTLLNGQSSKRLKSYLAVKCVTLRPFVVWDFEKRGAGNAEPPAFGSKFNPTVEVTDISSLWAILVEDNNSGFLIR